MTSNSQFLHGQFSETKIEQLIENLRGMRPVENDISHEETNVNKENRRLTRTS